MKNLILFFGLLAGTAAFAQAQTMHKSPEQRANAQTRKLRKTLNLTADQSTKVHAIILAQASRIDSLKASPVFDKKSMHRAHKSIMMTTNNRLRSVLSPVQLQSYAQLKETQKENRLAKKQSLTMPATPPTE